MLKNSTTDPSPGYRQIAWLAVLVIIALSVVVYWITSYRTIAWWDNPETAIGAATLSVVHAPGALLLTIFGWLASVLVPAGSKIVVLNGLAGVLAAATAGLTALLALRLFRMTKQDDAKRNSSRLIAFAAGATMGGLAFAFSDTLWEYALRLTPYVVTPLFTALIMMAALRWWRIADDRSSHRALFVMTLLIGLDFSVHRTNAVLVPGLILWILVRHPKTMIQPRSWLAAFGGLVSGLAVHLVIIPMAWRDPWLNVGNPSTLSRFWDYVSLKQAGGGFLMQLVPRKAPLWSVQFGDFGQALINNFFSVSGVVTVGVLLAGIVGLFGLLTLWRANRRLAIAWFGIIAITSVVTVLYFNIPANFFRSLHRHYLPCMVLLAVLVAYGSGRFIQYVGELKTGKQSRLQLLIPALLLVALMPVGQLARNFRAKDRSHVTFARDYAYNLLAPLARNAILFTAGDNDTFTTWYMQAVEHFRTDVTTINLPLLNTSWFAKKLLREDPGFPCSLSPQQIDSLRPIAWKDSAITMAVSDNVADFGLPDTIPIPDSVTVTVSPSVPQGYLLVADRVLIDLLRTNQWRRPIYFAASTGNNPAWLQGNRRLEGLVYRVLPVKDPPLNVDDLKHTLYDVYSYDGWADKRAPIDVPSQWAAESLYRVFLGLAQAQAQAGDMVGALETCDRMEALLPFDRVSPSRGLRESAAALRRQLEAVTSPTAEPSDDEGT